MLRGLLNFVRTASGDDAYERYARHHACHHPGMPLPTRAEFEQRRQEEKWRGVNRCC